MNQTLCFLAFWMVGWVVLGLPAGASPWQEMVDRDLAAMPDSPSIEDLTKLAGYAAVESENPESLAASARARERLYALPDFAERLAAHLREEKAKWVSGEVDGAYQYNSERGYILPLLGRIPHPSAVKVLGEFLGDEEWPEYANASEAIQAACPSPNSILAAQSLGILIEKPPVQKDWISYGFPDAKVWELWYAQVKAGTRTFRFKGDSQEYNLLGPVSTVSALPEPRKHRAQGPVAPLPAPEKGSWLPLIASGIACGLLGLALWVVRKRITPR